LISHTRLSKPLHNYLCFTYKTIKTIKPYLWFQ